MIHHIIYNMMPLNDKFLDGLNYRVVTGGLDADSQYENNPRFC